MTVAPSERRRGLQRARLNKHQRHTRRRGWLRAAVLGANDGILSTASLVLGVAAAHAPISGVLVAGVAGAVAGAMSMAAGEYVSVSSQADAERADLEIERKGLERFPREERDELAGIYVKRGLAPSLAQKVAKQLMAHNALDAHARDELGISPAHRVHPLQASFASACSFAVGGSTPLLTLALAPERFLVPCVGGVSLISLALLGGWAARAAGASVARGTIRVTFWGALAMGLTTGVGILVGMMA
jgi:VIT1/CCC1 family predicted Fe2+/Mn2+ transporter